jgi:hypothetical protein
VGEFGWPPGLHAAGVINLNQEPTLLASAVRQALDEQKHTDAALGAAEGVVLYGLFDQLHIVDGQVVHFIAEGIKGALLNTANLSMALAAVGSAASRRIPEAFLPFAQPVISGCLNHAENWCHEHILNAADPVVDHPDVAQSALESHGDSITEPAASSHEAWLNPSDSITSHPMEVMATHLDHVDAAGHVGESLAHGTVDAGISHVGDHTDNVAGLAVHVPWFTLLRSGHREYQLLQSGKTDAGTATKNVAIDTASMAVGAKGGAAIGTLIFPGVGTAIGAGLGGLMGKWFGTEVKQKDMKAALADLERHAETVQKAEAEINSKIAGEFEERKRAEQLELDKTATKLTEDAERSAREFAAWRAAGQTIQSTEASKLLTAGLEELNVIVESLRKNLLDIEFTRRMLWPDVQVEATRLAIDQLIDRQQSIKALMVEAHTKHSISTSVLFTFLGQAGISESNVRGFLLKDEAERTKRQAQFEDKLKQSQADIQQGRYEAVGRLDSLLKGLTTTAKEKLEPMAKQLEYLGGKVLREKEKLGLA